MSEIRIGTAVFIEMRRKGSTWRSECGKYVCRDHQFKRMRREYGERNILLSKARKVGKPDIGLKPKKQ